MSQCEPQKSAGPWQSTEGVKKTRPRESRPTPGTGAHESGRLLQREAGVALPSGPKNLSEKQLEGYFLEIEKCENHIVQKMATIVGKDQIAKYLSYLDRHDELKDPPQPLNGDSTGSVLRKPDIDAYCRGSLPPLIEPLDRNRLHESASYELRLGSRYRLGSSRNAEWLTDTEDRTLTIPAHGIAVVTTYEWLNIPGYLIARWNLRVRMVYRGLVWVGSLQVDPGYQGFLFCPIYNLSDRPQALRYKDPLFIIDFVTTTRATGEYDAWHFKRHDRYATFDFDRLDDQKIDSAPKHDIDRLDKDVKVDRFKDTMLTVVGVIVAAVAIIATFGLGKTEWDSNWVPSVLAGFALALSLVAIIVASRKQEGRSVGLLFAAVTAVAAAVAFVAIRPTVDVGPGGILLSFWPMTALAGAGLAIVLSVFALAYLHSLGRRLPH